jgi:phosphomannomutase
MTLSKTVIACDLDGTLAPSKQPLQEPMGSLLCTILETSRLAVISGASFGQFETQFLSHLPCIGPQLGNLHIFPVNGSAYFSYDTATSGWKQIYADVLDDIEKQRIFDALGQAIPESGADVQDARGPVDIVEDRGSQITFSGLGQDAPLEAKQAWDPDEKKRAKIAAVLERLIPEFEIRIGGATSIDITRKGITKAYAIRKIEEYLGVAKEDIVFIGDALFPGGNDSAAKETGVRCISVSGPEETMKVLQEIVPE